MSVQITFEPDSGGGLVAEGTYIWEAARRLGVPVVADCKGRGECVSCAVEIARGADLLSPVTSAEERMLGQDRLEHPGRNERLACQAILERQGEIRVRLEPVREGEQQQRGSGNTLRGLPFNEKVGALIELEAITVSEALNSMRAGYHALLEKFLNLTPQTTKEAQQTTKQAQPTTEHTTNEPAAGNAEHVEKMCD